MLYIVGTPIGNMDDLSMRQARTLAASDVIITEDSRGTPHLLSRIHEAFKQQVNPEQKIISYYKEKEFEKLPEVLGLLEEGKTVSLISESGMPLVSDPGFLLVKTCIKKHIPFAVIPGPTAVTTALVASGFNPANFMFLGFLPKKRSQLLHYINIMKSVHESLPDCIFVFYESPHRIQGTLQLLAEAAPTAQVAVCRELTKKFEEIVRGSPSELARRTYKGELTLVLSLLK